MTSDAFYRVPAPTSFPRQQRRPVQDHGDWREHLLVGHDQQKELALNFGGALGAVTVNGSPVRRGLVYAGQNGANEYQGNPPGIKLSPRVGAVYSISPKIVVRAGYGVW